mgnify:CR=1 FL=1
MLFSSLLPLLKPINLKVSLSKLSKTTTTNLITTTHPASVAVYPQFTTDKPTPIRVAPKGRKMPAAIKLRRAHSSPLFDDRGFPDPHHDWEAMLPEVKAVQLLQKQVHDALPINGIDINF